MKRFFIMLILALGLPAQKQTSIDPSQIRSTITTVEWAKCTFVSADGKQDCRGIELYRFRLADGTVVGPFFGVPVPANFVKDPNAWNTLPLSQ